jgi:glc operon protein GlcG
MCANRILAIQCTEDDLKTTSRNRFGRKSMTKKSFIQIACAAATAFALAPGSISALGQDKPPVQYIDLATAQKMVNAAEEAAKKANVHVGIAVVDANGDLVLSVRLDGAWDKAVTSCQGKARAAVLFGLPTKRVQDAMAAGKTVEAKLTAPVSGAAELTIWQGGLPIIRDGKVIGGIGVGGSPSPEDEKIAQAGIDAISTK